MSLPTSGEFVGVEELKSHKLSRWLLSDLSGTFLVADGYCCLNCEEFWKTKERVETECTAQATTYSTPPA